MAEFDETGIPLAYCFVDVFEDNRKGERNAVLATAQELTSKTTPTVIFEAGFIKSYQWVEPCLFWNREGPGGDLCGWSDLARRDDPTMLFACTMDAPKLRTPKEANNQNEHRPLEAQNLIPNLELC
jgi:hypothetical protein